MAFFCSGISQREKPQDEPSGSRRRGVAIAVFTEMIRNKNWFFQIINELTMKNGDIYSEP